MKFYYNGQLMRTSKTHNYAYACVTIGKDGKYRCCGCSATYAGAEKVKTDAIRIFESSIDSHHRVLKAYEEGRNWYNSRKYGRVTFDPTQRHWQKDFIESCLIEDEAKLKEVNTNWQIVELTAQA